MTTDSQNYTYQHFSLSQLGASTPDLQLHINCYGEDAIEVHLENKRYQAQRESQHKKIFIVLSLYVIYCAAVTIQNDSRNVLLLRNHTVDLAFILWILYVLQCTFNLIKSEKIFYCQDFGLQLQIKRYWLRSSDIFIPSSHIFDVVINEVIENLGIHYILIVRTKSSLFKRKPIITIFNALQPSINCLEIVYRHLNKVMQKTVSNP